MSGSSRVSMISSAAALIGARGLSGTSFSDVLADGVLAWFIDLWRQSVLASGGCGGCPVAGVAMDADDEELTVAARAAFAAWTALLAEQLQAAGVQADRAGPIASIALTTMEGALVMCRVERSSAPLETAAGELMRLLAAG